MSPVISVIVLPTLPSSTEDKGTYSMYNRLKELSYKEVEESEILFVAKVAACALLALLMDSATTRLNRFVWSKITEITF